MRHTIASPAVRRRRADLWGARGVDAVFSSYRTTIAGLAAILTAVGSALAALTDADPATVPDWETVAAAIAAGFGLLFARDNGVSSEKAKARR